MKLKVLPLEYWMTVEDFLEEGLSLARYTSVPPVFQRDGIFLFDKKCWFEVDGRAYSYDRKQFLYSLSLLEISVITDKQANALREVIAQGLGTSSQRRMLQLYDEYVDLENTRRNTRKRFMKYYEEKSNGR